MAQASVKTVQFIDPRIEPQPDPVYDYIIGPTQNQYYKIPASGKSNSSLTFNNLTTLGADRAYLDTFELELTCTFRFNRVGTAGVQKPAADAAAGSSLVPNESLGFAFNPKPGEWTFDSFPFNKACDEVRININGGAFFSQPLSYVRAKERYMDQWELSKCYQNVCPYNKPILQTESGRNYNTTGATLEFTDSDVTTEITANDDPDKYKKMMAQYMKASSTNGYSKEIAYDFGFDGTNPAMPTRLGMGMQGVNQSAQGMDGGYNNSIVHLGKKIPETDATRIGWENYYIERSSGDTIIVVTWREPIFCSPFSSRYDATYGRPLYNITSMDLSFTMPTLTRMLRYANYSNCPLEMKTKVNTTVTDHVFYSGEYISGYTVNIDSALLCYQVMTIPSILTKPLTTLVPYRRFVPYITDYNQRTGVSASMNIIPQNGGDIDIWSGVYTFNEIPTAIWVFIAPERAYYQENNVLDYCNDGKTWVPGSTLPANATAVNLQMTHVYPSMDSNGMFAYIDHVDFNMANTTQILNLATNYDLYRIAKANGCQDSYWSWSSPDSILPRETWAARKFTSASAGSVYGIPQNMYYGAGSVLRVKPGVDLIIPDQPLIPGANGNNMVFQAHVHAHVPPHASTQNHYSLWLLFEYVGVAAISPGQCEITMNPLGTGEVMAVSPVMSATSTSTEGNIEGSGFWDKTKKGASIAAHIADSGIISRILKNIPGAAKAADWAAKHGFGEPECKKARGGAVIGHGMGEWV